MTQRQKALLSCAVAAALLLSGCRKGSSDSGSMSSSNAMSGSSGSASTTQTGGWKTGLGILTEASDEARTGTIHTIAAAVLLDRLKAAGIRAQMDDSDQSMGWKAAQYEMKGVPLRVEIGPKDMEKGQCCICRRDSGEKVFVPLAELEAKVQELLDAVHDGLFQRAKQNLEDHTKVCRTLDEVKSFMEGEGGFAKTMWCGELECELKMKEQAGVTSRCMPLKQEAVGDTCVCCGKPAKHMIYWGVAY